MKLKNKILFSAASMLVVVSFLSTVAVSFLISRQNREASREDLNRSFKIIRERIASLQGKLAIDTRQMASLDDMGAKIQLVTDNKKSGDTMLSENTYIEISNTLYNVAISSNVARVRAYDTEGDLVAFILIKGQESRLGFPQFGDGKKSFRTAVVKTGAKPEIDAWKTVETVEGIDPRYPEGGDGFEIIDGLLSIVGSAPSMAMEYNQKTNNLEPVKIGTIIADLRLGDEFVRQMADLTDTAVNIFSTKGFSSGTIPEHNKLDLALFPAADNSWQLNRQEPAYADMDIGGESYFQGILPFYSQKGCIAAVSVLYSQNIARSNTVQMVKVLIGISVFCIVLLLPMAYVFSNSLSRPILKVKEFAGKLEKGVLSEKLPAGKDEIGEMGAALNAVVDELKRKAAVAIAISEGDLQQSVNVSSTEDILGKALETMLLKMNDTIVNIQMAADQVDTGSSQISDSSQALSQGATEQAASLEEITSSMTEIGSQTKTNAENAAQANQLAVAAKQDSIDGVDQMRAMSVAMNAISDSSREISKIIKTIDGIAFQTNLLALNAAVEAARAGKHGKGFAVVAQEVRSLAARSAKAAQETAQLIEASARKVQDGNAIAEKTGNALSKIHTGINRVADLVGEIAAASNEQAQAISQVSLGLAQIDNVTQRNTASAEETSSAAEELSSQAAKVRSLLSIFRVNKEPAAFQRRNTEVRTSPEARQLPAGNASAWGRPMGGAGQAAGSSAEPFIALDDEEFGKY
ncbi:MAG: methyl-accepting chemotaxis protein [Thermodesulfobacteriota bacterium]